MERRQLPRRRVRQLRLGCDVVEIEVDRDTWQVTPIALTTVHEIGKAIHPMLASGQIEGGSAQGLGYALIEEVVMRDGRMANRQLTNYLIPTTLDTPPFDLPPGEHGVNRLANLVGTFVKASGVTCHVSRLTWIPTTSQPQP